MMNSSIKKIIKDIILIEIGLAISSFGTSLFYASGLGSSAMATFSDGLHNVLAISYGDANMLANVVFLIILAFLNYKFINIGTILCVFTIGPWVDFFTAIVANLNIVALPLIIKIVITISGAAFMGVGLGLYMAVGRGFGALEGVVKWLVMKTPLTIKTAKILQDVFLSVSGILLGGAWGLGTIIGIVVIGPILQASSMRFGQLLNRL